MNVLFFLEFFDCVELSMKPSVQTFGNVLYLDERVQFPKLQVIHSVGKENGG